MQISDVMTAAVRPLAQKAMLVKLTTKRPNTARREKVAEALVQTQMGDTSLTVSSHIFKDKAHPVRLILNHASTVYSYHMANTLAWQDRGPRILPVAHYDTYNREMRSRITAVESMVHGIEDIYPGFVKTDIAQRAAGGTRSPSDFEKDYPTYDEFRDKMRFEFLFTPMPDEGHFLFDIGEDDRQALREQLEHAEKAAKQELTDRIRSPLVHLIDKLKKQIGAEGAIFRDSAVANIVEECAIAEALAMDDESVLAMVKEVRAAIRPYALAPNQLRESPIVRTQAAAKLADVAARMAFMSNN
jgi:hypothetical protein